MYTYIYVHVVGVSFNQSSYTVNEGNKQAQPVLVLSRPLSIDITVQLVYVHDSSLNATSES